MMNRCAVTFLLSALARIACAQSEIPASRGLWGKSPDYIATRILSQPGFRLAKNWTDNGLLLVAYQSTDGTYETLTYTFRRDSLVAIIRHLPLPYKEDVAPDSTWQSVGLNEWIVPKQKVWIKRYYDGNLIRDVFRRVE